MALVAGVQRLHRIGERAMQPVAGEHQLHAQRVDVRLVAGGFAERFERAREPRERVRELGVVGVQRAERLRRREPPHAVGEPRRDRAAQRLGLLAALRESALRPSWAAPSPAAAASPGDR